MKKLFTSKAQSLLIVSAFSLMLAACSSIVHAAPPAPTPTPLPTEDFPEGELDNSFFPLNTSLRFDQLSLEDGLSQSVVHTILQDKFGFLWIGTQDGLNRYDGHTFTIFRPDPDDPTTINDRWISSLYEDSEGYLWVGTRFGGLNRYDPESGTFTHFINDPDNPQSLSSNRVSAILEDSRGDLWVGTNNGLDRFNRETGVFEHYRSDPNLDTSISSNSITVVYEDSRGVLWVGSERGLNRYNALTSTFTTFKFNPWDSIGHNNIRAIVEDSPESLWIATYQGLILFNTGDGSFIHYEHRDINPTSLADNTVLSLYKDKSETLWVGTSNGIDIYQPETRNFIHYRHNSSNPTSLSNDNILTIYEDRGGILWFGTIGSGLNRYNSQQRNFTYYRAEEDNPNSLSSNVIFPIHAEKSGIIWIGAEDGGLDRFDPVLGEFTHYEHDPENPDSLPSNNIHAIYVDVLDNLWVGSNEGLSRLNTGTDKFIHYSPKEDTENGLISKNVSVIYEDRLHNLWIGTNKGVDQFNPITGTFTHHQASTANPNSLSDNVVSTIFQDRFGTLWIGTYFGGLNRYDAESDSFSHYRHNPKDTESLTHDFIMSIYEDSQQRLWIATGGGGLNLYDREKDSFTHYLEKDGLPNDFIYGILEDQQGDLWLSTNFGLSRFDPETETFRNYTSRDGLQSNEFNMSAYAIGKDGSLYFGGINGLNIFTPDEVKDNTYLPPVVLTRFLLDGLPVPEQPQAELIQEVSLVWPQNDFAFEFSALDYAQPARNQHAYILENFDRDWNYIGTRRDGRYTNLPGGTYTLRVKGSNSDGVWNENGQTVLITVVPPFWQTIYFRSLAVLALLGFGIVAYRLRVQGVQTQNQNLEILVHERTSTLQKRTEEIEALYSGNEKIIRAMTLEQVFQALVEVAVNTLHADRSVVFVWDEKKKQAVPRVSHGFDAEILDVLAFVRGEGLIGRVLETGEALIISEVDLMTLKPKTREAVAAEGIRSLLHLPIKVDDQLIGVFNISFTRPQAITDDTVRLFTTLVQRAELSLENMQLFEKTKEVAVIEERNRVARELHDSAKQKAFAALAQLGAVSGILDHNIDGARTHLLEAENLVYDVLQELTFLIQEMYPMALKEKGLATTLREYVFEWKNRNEMMVNLSIENEISMPLDAEQAVYRMIQEALANIARHSRATQVDILLDFASTILYVKVEDNGQGFDLGHKPNGIGLRTIIDRADEIGGQAFVKSAVGEGTTISIELPLNRNK